VASGGFRRAAGGTEGYRELFPKTQISKIFQISNPERPARLSETHAYEVYIL